MSRRGAQAANDTSTLARAVSPFLKRASRYVCTAIDISVNFS